MRPGVTAFFRVLLCLLLFSAYPARGINEVGPAGQYHLVHNYQNDWLVYSDAYRNYVPFTRSLHETESSVSLLLHLLKNRNYSLLLNAQQESYLFIGGTLQKKLAPHEWLVLPCDSLYRIYREEELLVTLYGATGTDGLTAYMGYPRNRSDSTGIAAAPLTSSLVSIRPKNTSSFQDFSILVLLIILILAAAGFHAAPGIVGKIANPGEFFNSDYRSELYYHYRPYSPIIVLGVIILSLLMAFLALLLRNQNVGIFPGSFPATGNNGLPALFGIYLQLFLVCFILCYLKYLLIAAADGILNFSNVADFHFIKALQSSLLFYSMLILGWLAVSRQAPEALDLLAEYLFLPVFLFYGVRFVLLYILINRSKRFINLYLFSYLCVIEIIPVIIGVKFAL